MGYPKVIGAGACIYSLGFPKVIGGAVIAAKWDAGNAAKRIADIATCCDCNMDMLSLQHAVIASFCICIICWDIGNCCLCIILLCLQYGVPFGHRSEPLLQF